MRIYVWNVLVKTQSSDWFRVIDCEKSAEFLERAPWCVPELGRSPWSPQQRWRWGVHALTPKELPCLSIPSTPHCLTRGVFISSAQPLDNMRAINSGEGENVWVWHIVCIPAFPNTQARDQKFAFIGSKLHTVLWLTNVLPGRSLLLVYKVYHTSFLYVLSSAGVQ